MPIKQLQEDIIKLKQEQDVVILAHYYQPIEIQEIADFIGGSLELSRTAKEKVNTEYIIFAGVDFMAETASIINPEKHVLIPNYEACCPMAAFLTPEMVIEFKKEHPGLPVVVYVNSTAVVKAESDICCTSANAVKIVKNISQEFNVEAVLFGPDANLADYSEYISGVKCIPMPEVGHCYVHSQIKLEHVRNAHQEYPRAKLLVHPECIREVRELADFVGSTAQMYNRVKNSTSDEKEFIIGTEVGLLERMAQDFPKKNFYLVKDKLICYQMKKHNLELIESLLKNLDDKAFEVKVPPEIAKRAINPIEKMLDFS
ncbi:MAG: quinolinate synthase NadA [Candidatus Lokiarchaeota archaeon]|nr:quinolinate synthase NadA [Candidatus Lokiarchaeota archaeon]